MKRYIKAAKTIEDYENMGVFDVHQMEQIREGLEKGVDVSIYADPKFDDEQMDMIRLGLKDGLDVSQYADPKYDSDQMYQIWDGLEDGLDVSAYADPKFNGSQMSQIRKGLKDGLDISWYADPKFDWEQMSQIRKGLEKGLDVSTYADPKYDEQQMFEIRESLLGITKTKKQSRINWKSLVKQLQSEAKNGIDSLYEQTKAGQQVESICKQVESKLGLFVETSVQAGRGSIDFYKDEMAAHKNYRDFNEAVYNLAVNASSKKNFESSYEAFLEYDLMWNDVE